MDERSYQEIFYEKVFGKNWRTKIHLDRSTDGYLSGILFEHKKNGYLIQDYSKIEESISFYLDSMENWNEALVACYEIGKEYTTKNLLDSWRRVLDVV